MKWEFAINIQFVVLYNRNSPDWIFIQFDARFHQFHLWAEAEIFKLQEEHEALLSCVEEVGMGNATSCFCTQNLEQKYFWTLAWIYYLQPHLRVIKIMSKKKLIWTSLRFFYHYRD